MGGVLGRGLDRDIKGIEDRRLTVYNSVACSSDEAGNEAEGSTQVDTGREFLDCCEFDFEGGVGGMEFGDV